MRYATCLWAALLMLVAVGAQGQTVTYSLASQTPLLQDSFYESGSGKIVFNSAANGDGSKVVFWAYDWGTGLADLYTVDVGSPSSAQLLYAAQINDIFINIDFSPDFSHVLIASDADSTLVDAVTGDATVIGSLWFPGQVVDFLVKEGKYTSKPSNNYWFQRLNIGGGLEDIAAIPVNADGSAATSREPILITDMALDTLSVGSVSADGSMVVFTNERTFGSGGAPTEGDLYVLSGVDEILAAPKNPGTDVSSLAPTSLADPRIATIRLSSEDPGMWNGVAHFSQDKRLVYYSVETTDTFVTEDFPTNLPISDWDIFISNSDGSGSDFQLVEPGNQGLLRAFPAGARFSFVQDGPGTPGPVDVRVYLTNVETTSELEPMQSDPLPQGETMADVGGETVDLGFELTDSAVQTTEDVMLEDGTGTMVSLPMDQVINFPDGTTEQSISISTPIDPVTDAELPDSGFVGAFPVLREFGPSGTQFYPPIEISITYSDSEIVGLEEESLTPYLFNESTGKFDIAVPEEDIVSRDLVNNVVVFRVDHFSTYALGFVNPASVPASTLVSLLIAAGLLLVSAAVVLRARARRAG